MQMHIFGELKWRQLGGMHHKSYGAASGFVSQSQSQLSDDGASECGALSATSPRSPARAVGNLLPSLLLVW